MKSINVHQLDTAIKNDPPPVLLDVREAWEFEHCHIDGSLNISMSQIPAEKEKLDPTREVVVICHHGIRSFQVASCLAQAGFTRVMNLTGGVDEWARSIDTDMPQY